MACGPWPTNGSPPAATLLFFLVAFDILVNMSLSHNQLVWLLAWLDQQIAAVRDQRAAQPVHSIEYEELSEDLAALENSRSDAETILHNMAR